MLRRECILLLLTLFGHVRNSLGFAAWLKCNRRLEEDEIIMSNKVRKALVDDEPVRLAVYDEAGSRVDIPSIDNSGESVVWIDTSDTSSSKSYQIRMDATTIEGLSDIQYVVETSPFDGIHSPGVGSKPKPPDSPSPAKKIPAVISSSTVSPTPSSAFISASTGGGILCNGQRAHARGKASYVNYEYTTNKTQEIVAGWSEYHGRVTLTPKVTFKRKDDDTISQEQDEL